MGLCSSLTEYIDSWKQLLQKYPFHSVLCIDVIWTTVIVLSSVLFLVMWIWPKIVILGYSCCRNIQMKNIKQ